MALNNKILQVVNIPFVLPYFFGDQIFYLKELGLDITIACSPGIELDRFCDKYSVGKFPIQVVRKIDLNADVSSLIKLVKFMRREKFSFVIGHTPKGGLLAMLAGKLAGVENRVYFRHGIVYETSKGFKRKLMVLLERITSRLATQVVSVSPSVRYVSSGLKSNNLKDILLNKGTCNGIDLRRFFPSNRNLFREKLGLSHESKVVGFVGRLVNDKGIYELTEAWKKVIKLDETAKLLLIGPFEERDALLETTKQFIISEPSIIYIGHTEDVVPYYNAMDIFILPSYREGFPTVVLEASAMELPVITTKSTGCIDSIVENETGIFTQLNEDSIFESILYYLNHDDLRRKHGSNGRVWVEENFRQEIIWKEIKQKVFKIR